MGWIGAVRTWFFSRFPFLTDLWARGQESRGDTPPWTPFQGKLEHMTMGLVSTGGVHRTDQDPFDTEDPDGDPTLRIFDLDVPREELTITHPYYDHTDAEEDLELVLPRQTLQDFAATGRLAGTGPRGYSLMGHVDGPHVETLVEETAPRIAASLAEDGVDAVLLVPA